MGHGTLVVCAWLSSLSLMLPMSRGTQHDSVPVPFHGGTYFIALATHASPFSSVLRNLRVVTMMGHTVN
jgi:hypothetical protein